MRKLLAIGLMLAGVTVAFAQPEPEFKLTVTAKEADMIGRGLGSLPFADVAPLMQKLRQQVMEQQSPPPKAATPPVEPKKK